MALQSQQLLLKGKGYSTCLIARRRTKGKTLHFSLHWLNEGKLPASPLQPFLSFHSLDRGMNPGPHDWPLNHFTTAPPILVLLSGANCSTASTLFEPLKIEFITGKCLQHKEDNNHIQNCGKIMHLDEKKLVVERIKNMENNQLQILNALTHSLVSPAPCNFESQVN